MAVAMQHGRKWRDSNKHSRQWGIAEGVAVECLKSELEKAKKASQRPPLSVEVDECRKFIARSEKRLADLDRERESEQSALTDAKVRLQRLEGRADSTCRRGPHFLQIGRPRWKALQAQVTAMREERDQGPIAKRQAVGHIPSPQQWRYPTDAHPCPRGVGQLDARSPVGSPECNESRETSVVWWRSARNWPKALRRWSA